MNRSRPLRVSVIITTHNRFDLLFEAVRSVLQQTCPPIEICIVDDGSTPAVTEQWERESLIETQVPIRFVRLENEGPSAARNAGADLARGDYFAFLDDDDQMMPKYIERAVDALSKGIDVTVAWMRCFGQTREWPGKHFPVDHMERDPYERNMGFVASNIIVSQALFERIGGYDPHLLGSEDKDLYIRLKQAGARFEVLTEELIRYRVHKSEQASGQYRFHPFQVSGKRLFLEKHGTHMTRAVHRKLSGECGLFQLFGADTMLDRLKGLWGLCCHDPGRLLVAGRIVVIRMVRGI